MPNPSGHLSRQRSFVLTKEDDRNISIALKKAFPSLVFVATNCLRTTAYTSDNDYTEDPPGPGAVLPIYDTLASPPGVEHMRGYLIDPHWEPGWEHRRISREGREIWRPLLSNEPRLWFEYQDSGFGGSYYGDWFSSSGRVWAWYPREDKEHARFVSKVLRIFTSFCTNALDHVYDDTGEPYFFDAPRTVWVGRSAVEWCKADPMRRLDGNMRPEGSPGIPIPHGHWSYGSCKNRELARDYAVIMHAKAELEALRRKKR